MKTEDAKVIWISDKKKSFLFLFLISVCPKLSMGHTYIKKIILVIPEFTLVSKVSKQSLFLLYWTEKDCFLSIADFVG